MSDIQPILFKFNLKHSLLLMNNVTRDVYDKNKHGLNLYYHNGAEYTYIQLLRRNQTYEIYYMSTHNMVLLALHRRGTELCH